MCEKVDKVVCGVIIRDGKLLVMQHRKHDMVTIPIGKVEDFETPEQAIIREMEEEIGCAVTLVGEPCVTNRTLPIPNAPKVTEFCYTLDIGSVEPVNVEPHKHDWVAFKSIEELRNMGVRHSEALKGVLASL